MPPDSMASIRIKVARECRPTSIRLRVEMTQTPPKNRSNADRKPLVFAYQYDQTSSGQRRYDETMTEVGGRSRRVSGYSDGLKCAEVRYRHDRQTDIYISRNFLGEASIGYVTAPAPFRFSSVGLTPLDEALPNAVRLDEATIIDRPCDGFRFDGIGAAGKTQSLIYYLDRATAVPLRIAAYSNPDRVQAGLANWIWQAKTLDTIGDRHFPLESHEDFFAIDESSPDRPIARLNIEQEIHVKLVEYDVNIPQSTFWPVLQPGVLVSDRIAQKSYQVPDVIPEKWRETPKAATGAPIRAADSSGPGVWPWVGMTLSIAVLVAAVVLWRRSH